MKTTAFNPIQIHLLRMFEHESSSKSLEELKDVLYQYYTGRMDAKRGSRNSVGIYFSKSLIIPTFALWKRINWKC